MDCLSLKRTNLNSLLLKQLGNFLSAIKDDQAPRSVLVIGFSVCKDTPTKIIVQQLVKHHKKKQLNPPDIVIGDCNSSVIHQIAHAATGWGFQTTNSTQQFVEQKLQSLKITGLYGNWFSKEASFYWKSYNLVISVKRVEKLKRGERLYNGPYPLQFRSSEKLADAVRRSYYFLDRFLTSFLSAVSSNNGQFFLMLEIFDPDKIDFLTYRLVNDAFFKAASATELSDDVVHDIISPFMVFRSERLVEKLTKFFHRFDNFEIDIKIFELPCMCTSKFVGNLDRFEDKQRFSNEMIGCYFTWVEEEIKECSALTSAQKVNLVVETRSALRNTIMDILCSGRDYDFNTSRLFLNVQGKYTRGHSSQTILEDGV